MQYQELSSALHTIVDPAVTPPKIPVTGAIGTDLPPFAIILFIHYIPKYILDAEGIDIKELQLYYSIGIFHLLCRPIMKLSI